MERFMVKPPASPGFPVELEAYGFSFEEALQNACVAVSLALVPQAQQIHAGEKMVIEERAGNLEELAGLVLSNLLSQANERELVVKEATVQEFNSHPAGGGVRVRLVGHAGTLEEACSAQLYTSVEVAEGGVTSSEHGSWKICALVSTAGPQEPAVDDQPIAAPGQEALPPESLPINTLEA